ncbi:hypothetical protein HK097_002110, partial [Rhizophlyctis rosea]
MTTEKPAPSSTKLTTFPPHTNVYSYLYSHPTDPFHLSTYLTRIGLPHSLTTDPPTKSLLDNLHWSHLSSIPFENLSTTLWRKDLTQSPDGTSITLPLSIRPQDIWTKLVLQNRGG